MTLKTVQWALVCLSVFSASQGLYCGSAAAAYPDKTIRLVVGTPPGDSPDISARLFAAALSNQMGQTVLVDNRPGASHTIAFNIVAKAQPDGYTIGWGTFLLATSPILLPKLPYDPVKDLQMIMQAVYTPNLLAVTPSLPVTSVSDLINHAKKNPDQLSFASAGNASSLHLGMELFKLQTGTRMLHVPYKGSQLAIADVISGQVHVICDNIASIITHVQGNRVRGLAVSSLKRSPMVPDLPTISEAGVPGFVITPFGGPFAPAGLPRSILKRLNDEFNIALQSPRIKEFFDSLGNERVGGTPQQFSQLVKNELAKWAEVVKRTGAKLD